MQPLGRQVGRLRAHAGDVCARAAQVGDQTGPHRIADTGEHDRDAAGGAHGGLRCERSESGNQDVRVGAHEFGGQFRQAFRPTFGRTILNHHVLAFAVTQLLQSLQQYVRQGYALAGKQGEVTDPI